MTRPTLFVVCATMAFAAGPATVRAATGPDGSAAVTGCQEQIEGSAERTPKGEWRERLGDWLRRQRQRDSVARGGYYLRSPLLYAFGPGTPEDCAPEEERAQDDAVPTSVQEKVAPGTAPEDATSTTAPRAPDRCAAALVVGTRTDSEV